MILGHNLSVAGKLRSEKYGSVVDTVPLSTLFYNLFYRFTPTTSTTAAHSPIAAFTAADSLNCFV